MLQEVVLIDNKQVAIQWPEEMSEDGFQDFTDWLKLLHRKIGRTVSGGDRAKLDFEDDAD